MSGKKDNICRSSSEKKSPAEDRNIWQRIVLNYNVNYAKVHFNFNPSTLTFQRQAVRRKRYKMLAVSRHLKFSARYRKPSTLRQLLRLHRARPARAVQNHREALKVRFCFLLSDLPTFEGIAPIISWNLSLNNNLWLRGVFNFYKILWIKDARI